MNQDDFNDLCENQVKLRMIVFLFLRDIENGEKCCICGENNKTEYKETNLF